MKRVIIGSPKLWNIIIIYIYIYNLLIWLEGALYLKTFSNISNQIFEAKEVLINHGEEPSSWL